MSSRKSSFTRVLAAGVEDARGKFRVRKPVARITTILLEPATADVPQDQPPFMYRIRYREES